MLIENYQKAVNEFLSDKPLDAEITKFSGIDKIPVEDANKILSITKKDYTTYLMFCFYFLQKIHGVYSEVFKKLDLIKFHQLLINYNKNILPIKDFDFYTVTFKDSFYIIDSLYKRNKILTILKNYPSTLIRNIKKELQIPRNFNEISKYLDLVEYLHTHLSMFYGRDELIIKKIEPKIFSSRNNTVNKLIDFFEEYINNTEEFSLSEIELRILIENDPDITLKYENENGLIIEVDSQEGMVKIGCNSMWCFSRKGAYRDFYNYSTNGIVYVIYDKRYKQLFTLVGYIEDGQDEDDSNLYDIYNHQADPIILKDLFGENYINLFDFESSNY